MYYIVNQSHMLDKQNPYLDIMDTRDNVVEKVKFADYETLRRSGIPIYDMEKLQADYDFESIRRNNLKLVNILRSAATGTADVTLKTFFNSQYNHLMWLSIACTKLNEDRMLLDTASCTHFYTSSNPYYIIKCRTELRGGVQLRVDLNGLGHVEYRRILNKNSVRRVLRLSKDYGWGYSNSDTDDYMIVTTINLKPGERTVPMCDLRCPV